MQELPDASFWDTPSPLPPEHDFLADVLADRKLVALLCAVNRIAKQRGVTLTQQIGIWTQ